MNEQTLQMLQALADKLNTTAENLWAVLIAQARIEGIVSIIWATACLVVIIIGIKVCKWIYNGLMNDDWDDIAFAPLCLVGIATVILIFPMIAHINWAITCLLNPEYYALTHILRAVR